MTKYEQTFVGKQIVLNVTKEIDGVEKAVETLNEKKSTDTKSSISIKTRGCVNQSFADVLRRDFKPEEFFTRIWNIIPGRKLYFQY